ncbi:MAG TPA: hypothetical protein VNT42_06470 [Sphingomonas sp.]|nr:hypothetical protein [Sphingomonas sp.]
MPVEEFAYHRSLTPTLAMLLGLAIAETLVVHLVAIAIWGWTAAVLVGIADLSLVVGLIALLRTIRNYPVTIADGLLTMRVGRLRTIVIPLEQVSGLRESWDHAALKRKDVSNLALAAWPNVFIDLAAPVRSGRREVMAVAHRLDDPATFMAAIRHRLPAV